MLRSFVWFLVGVLLSSVPLFAFAQLNAYPNCSGAPTTCSTVRPCQYNITATTVTIARTAGASNLGDGWTYANNCGGTGVHTKIFPKSCPSDQVWDAALFKCVPSPCQGGDTGEMRFDIGYTATGGANSVDWIGSPSPPDLNKGYCDGQCRVGIGSPLGCWKSTEGPPYVAYCSYETTKTGSTCSTSDSPPPTLDPIPCPSGTAPGAVNGVGGCYPVSETVTETAPPVPNPDGSSTTTTTTTNPDGTQTITSETTHPDGSKTVTITTGPGPGTGTGGGEGGEGGEGSEPVEFPAECVSDPSKCEDKTGKFEKGDKGTFDLAAANQEKQAALEALFEKWDEIREEMGEVWGGVNESNGSLPCLAQFMFLGTEIKMCMKPEWVDWLPKLVLLIAAIIAAFILFRE